MHEMGIPARLPPLRVLTFLREQVNRLDSEQDVSVFSSVSEDSPSVHMRGAATGKPSNAAEQAGDPDPMIRLQSSTKMWDEGEETALRFFHRKPINYSAGADVTEVRNKEPSSPFLNSTRKINRLYTFNLHLLLHTLHRLSTAIQSGFHEGTPAIWIK